MIKVENIEVFNFEGAIRGIRNPMNSWDKSDSIKCYANRNCPGICKNNSCGLCVGAADLDLMQRLFKAGTEHRKYLRQIFVSMDITAPLYWWKEFDTYKVGTVANSCSTMHKIAAKEFTIDDFSHEYLTPNGKDFLLEIIDALNDARTIYIDFDKYADSGELEKSITSKKDVWWQMIQLLPSSYNQRRTVTMNYENVFSIIKQRSGHKLDEWNEFVKVLKTLPYVMEISGLNDNDQ